MVGYKAKTRSRAQQIKRKAQQKTIKTLRHAGGTIRLAAMYSIRKRQKPAPPGHPPHTQTGRLHRALRYAVDKPRRSVVVGPTVEVFGTAGKAHEYGGRYRGARYPDRPFMAPALMSTKSRLPKFWANSLGR